MTDTVTDTGSEQVGLSGTANVVHTRRAQPDAKVQRAETRGIYRDLAGAERVVGTGDVIPDGWERIASATLEDRADRVDPEQGAGMHQGEPIAAPARVPGEVDTDAVVAAVEAKFAETLDLLGDRVTELEGKLDEAHATIAELEARPAPAEDRAEPGLVEDRAQTGPDAERAAKAAKKAAAKPAPAPEK